VNSIPEDKNLEWINQGRCPKWKVKRMANLAELMKGRVEDLVKGPPTLPIGDYPAVISKFELTQARNAEQTPILRFTARILDWPADDSIEESQKAVIENIANRTVNCDFWLPLDYKYGRLCQQCGITGEITEQTNYELVGKHVLAIVKHQISKKTGETWAVAQSFIGTE
jgi:hypothetical protein